MGPRVHCPHVGVAIGVSFVTMFRRLHNTDGDILYLDIDSIECVKVDEYGSLIKMKDGNIYIVKESPDFVICGVE